MSHKSEFKATTKHIVGPVGHITLEYETVWIVLLVLSVEAGPLFAGFRGT